MGWLTDLLEAMSWFMDGSLSLYEIPPGTPLFASLAFSTNVKLKLEK
jgi:hypothetical protein